MTSVLDLLRNPDSPRRAILRLLPGGDDRSQLVTFVAESAAHGPVVVLVKTLAELDQWSARLQPLVTPSPWTITSAAEALVLQEHDALLRPGVILSTIQRTKAGPLMTLLKGMEIELLVVDGPPIVNITGDEHDSSSNQTIALVAMQARRTVVVLTGTAPYHLEGAVPVREVSESDFSRAAAAVRVVDVSFEPTAEEVEVQDRARALLEPYLPKLGDRTLPLAGTSELHNQLLALVTGPSDVNSSQAALEQPTRLRPQEETAVWTMLDALESLPDAKLKALDSVLQRTGRDGRSCLITAMFLRDVMYIADHLRRAGRGNVHVVTSLVDRNQRESVMRFENQDQIVVAGRLAYDMLDQWPPNCDAVWWSPPRSRSEFEERMAVLATGEHVHVYQLIPQARHSQQG